LTWTGSSSADLLGYYIRYGTSATVWDGYDFLEKGQTTKRISNLRSGQTYYFQINATDGSNPSAYVPATPISVTIPGDTTVPAAPTGLSVVPGFNNIIAYWNRNSENDVDLGRGTYQFQLSTTTAFTSVLQDRTITGTVASFTGLTTGTTYYVRVRAIDASGNAGTWSNPGSATPGKISGQASIENGTIVGDLVAANTIVGDKLIANTIDADRLKTNTGIVGKLFVGDDAGTNKITIDGTAALPAIYYGTGTYNNANTPFYFDALGKFSLKDQLSWDGNALTVRGSLNVTQGSTFSANININSGADLILNGGTVRATGTGGRVDIVSGGIFGYNATTGGTALFSLFSNTGQVKIDGGQIGGWTIGPTSITAQNQNGVTVGLYSNGQLYMGPNFSVGANGSVTITGTLNVVGGNAATTTALSAVETTANNAASNASTAVNTANTANTNATSALNTANAALPASTFSKSEIIKKINNTTNGTTIDGGILTTGTVIADNVVSTYVYAGEINADKITSGTLTGRAINNGNGTFSVSSSGVLTATSATISGSITADSGSIAGFTITGVTDIEAKTTNRPRIMFGTKIALGWDDDYTYAQNYYGLRIGNSYTTTNARMVINTKDNVFRASIDTTRMARAFEVSNTVRAVNLEYTTSLVGPTSSRRFKDNITYVPKQYYERILDITPAFFVYKNDEEVLEEIRGSHGMGIIAEDLEEAGLGYFVQRDMYGRPTQLLDVHELSNLLIPIVRDMKQEIADLKNRIELLEA
jgi:titin